jgi:hypothetical protein
MLPRSRSSYQTQTALQRCRRLPAATLVLDDLDNAEHKILLPRFGGDLDSDGPLWFGKLQQFRENMSRFMVRNSIPSNRNRWPVQYPS